MTNTNKNFFYIVLAIVALSISIIVGNRLLESLNTEEIKSTSTTDVEFQIMKKRMAFIEVQLDKVIKQQTALLSVPVTVKPAAAEDKNDQKVKIKPTLKDDADSELENALTRIDQLENILNQEIEIRQTAQAQQQSKIERQQKIAKAANDPVIIEKYNRYLEDMTKQNNVSIEQQFLADAIDPYWAQETSSKITDALTSTGVTGLTVLSNECRSSFCRSEVVVPTSSQQEMAILENELIGAFASKLGAISVNIQSKTDQNGQQKYVLITSKNGAELTTPENQLANLDPDEAIQFLNSNY